MMIGLLLSLIAGSLLSLQTIFNSKVNEQAGSWSTTTLVLGLGFLASLLIGIILEGSHMFILQNMKTWYWFSGLIGIGVVTSLVQSIKLLGPTYAISIVLTSQLGFALICDSFGWLGLNKIPFTFQHLLGVLVICGGVVVFKFGGGQEKKEMPSKGSEI